MKTVKEIYVDFKFKKRIFSKRLNKSESNFNVMIGDLFK